MENGSLTIITCTQASPGKVEPLRQSLSRPKMNAGAPSAKAFACFSNRADFGISPCISSSGRYSSGSRMATSFICLREVNNTNVPTASSAQSVSAAIRPRPRCALRAASGWRSAAGCKVRPVWRNQTGFPTPVWWCQAAKPGRTGAAGGRNCRARAGWRRSAPRPPPAATGRRPVVRRRNRDWH